MHDLTPPSLQSPPSVALSLPCPSTYIRVKVVHKSQHLLTFISVSLFLFFFLKKTYKETNLIQSLFYLLLFTEMYLFTYLFILQRHHFRAINTVLFFSFFLTKEELRVELIKHVFLWACGPPVCVRVVFFKKIRHIHTVGFSFTGFLF